MAGGGLLQGKGGRLHDVAILYKTYRRSRRTRQIQLEVISIITLSYFFDFSFIFIAFARSFSGLSISQELPLVTSPSFPDAL